ncbi:MAG: hypothetical protein OEW15_05185 [Nitrospirota bacterium]|nr:hypothetical protein [Nitrospirota bacterium]
MPTIRHRIPLVLSAGVLDLLSLPGCASTQGRMINVATGEVLISATFKSDFAASLQGNQGHYDAGEALAKQLMVR